jgi:hypothetical protein
MLWDLAAALAKQDVDLVFFTGARPTLVAKGRGLNIALSGMGTSLRPGALQSPSVLAEAQQPTCPKTMPSPPRLPNATPFRR